MVWHRIEDIKVEPCADQPTDRLHRNTEAKRVNAKRTDHILDQRDSKHRHGVLLANCPCIKHQETNGDSDCTHAAINQLQVIEGLDEFDGEDVDLLLGSDRSSAIVQC